MIDILVEMYVYIILSG